ncbi:MAG: ribonuclease H-like domain-containing protein [Polyangiaceae bacterium]|nr:ribonuclease H-like domain-containing protein [Polyangiaceae bacterium]
MDLRSKLARLRAPEARPGEPAGAASAAGAGAALLAGPSVLPFVAEEQPGGALWVRRLRLARSHHVGRIPLSAARDAAPGTLALLALDPSLAACAPGGALYLDTETTGLGGAGTLAFLVGLAWLEGEDVWVEQLLLRSPAEEPLLLAHLARRVEAAGFFVTFNGKSFDLPLLEARRVMNRLPPGPARPHLDLVHVARRLHGRRLRQRRLGNLEAEVLGHVRVGDVDGSEIAARYAHFLRTGDETALEAVVEHNLLDVLSMVALVGLYGEPLPALCPADLAGMARTLARAGAPERALELADVAVSRGAGAEGLRARAELLRAQGDRARALADFEALARDVDDPAVRLALAKLYEHHVRDHVRALELVAAGTGEPPEREERRRRRLERKRDRRRP